MLRIAGAQDAFITSWVFEKPIWEADFGGGGPVRFQAALHPTPPFTAVVMAAQPKTPGLDVFITLSCSALPALRGSRVLKELAPGSRLL